MRVADLIHYNLIIGKLYFNSLDKLSWASVVEARGLSFDSMRNVFLHLTFVEDRWISYIIPGRFKEWVDPDFGSFRDIDTLKTYMQRVQKNTEIYLGKLSAEEQNRQIIVPWGAMPDTKISVETGLTHMVIEDMIHYGELSAAMWQMGVDAPYLGFWRYKHMHQ